MDQGTSSRISEDSQKTKIVSSSLLEMIDKVSQASDERSATVQLLSSLLSLFDLDQAALCEIQGDKEKIFAIDRTRKVIQDTNQAVWISKTLIDQALQSGSPIVHRDSLDFEDGIPKSITENSLKNVVCVPISKNQVVSLASQRNPLREYSSEELHNFKVAARAAWLGLKHHQDVSVLKSDNAKLQNALYSRDQCVLYASPKMERLFDEVSKIAAFNISILIQGESGVGKEELAKEIHRKSGRSGKFIAINCANLTETLLESELFGYAKGAFTGAANSKKGLFQEAEQGTIFLDEIAELPLNLQSKLLRVLQERSFRPLGSTQEIAVDVRFLSATHADLKSAVADKKFREDLFYRIQEMTFFIPPLRDRPEDIELLGNHFVKSFSSEFKLGEKKFSVEALKKLQGYSWPGNIRELKNICRTSVILSSGVEISADSVRLPEVATSKSEVSESAFEVSSTDGLKGAVERYERDLVEKMLSEPGQTQASVAEKLNVSTRTLQRILSKTTASINS
ncbi:MAG: sigma-54 interaction domain-containing protein [Bacteriovoracia bacterium]